MTTQAYEAGVEVALQEIAENLGDEAAEKVARFMGMGKKTVGDRVKGAKGWLGKKYKGAKKHVGEHKGAYGLGAGAAGMAGGRYAYDKYNE